MCYSKEVSLAAGATILAVSAYTWARHGRPRVADVQGATRLRAAFRSAIVAHLCIAGHQFLEFLAISTESHGLYRLGLLVSMSCLVFLFRSLEQLTGERYGSRWVPPVIAAVGLELSVRPVSFENHHFWVRGHSHALWGAVWMTAFLYWLVCIGHAAVVSDRAQNRRLLPWFGLGVLGATYVVSMTYTFLAAAARDVGPVGWLWRCAGAESLTEDHSIVMDTPSIWCVFATLQTFCLPALFRAMERGYRPEPPRPVPAPRAGTRLTLLAVASGISATMYVAFPVLHGIAAKMVTH